MSSKIEVKLEEEILALLGGRALEAARFLLEDKETASLQEYANHVSIRRLNYNDHGPVHMRTVARNAVRMAGILQAAGVPFAVEEEKLGSFEDVQTIIFTAAFLHDIGMGVGREGHEQSAVLLAQPILDRLLEALYHGNRDKQVMARCMIMEGVIGHMATHRVHTPEAGVILIADGCDMEQGRARIPMRIQAGPKIGDIHQFSASAIRAVEIGPGRERPLRIAVSMSESVGFFQVEEVLYPKIEMSPVKQHLELVASVKGGEERRYL